MIQAYVTCNVGNDTAAIDEHLVFPSLPRVGEFIRVGFPEYYHEIRVLEVSHQVFADPDALEPLSPCTLKCEFLRTVHHD